MTPSPAKVPKSSGRFEVCGLHPQDRGYRPAMSLILSGSPLWSEEVAEQVKDLESLARRQNLRMDLLVGGYSSAELLSAALAIESPGRTAMAYTTAGDTSGEERRAMAEVLMELQRRVWRRGVTVLQALLPPEDRARPGVHASAGFRYLAELINMDRPTWFKTYNFKPALRLRMVTYRPDRRQLFLRALEESYVESLDCPGLAGLRQTEDVLTGHMATGVYDPDGWFVAQVGEEPAGVMLTARVPNRSALEVVYVGVGRWARGQGVGDRLMAQAVAFAGSAHLDEVTLAVDSTNEAARRLYQRWNFVETSRRRAWIATSEKDSPDGGETP